MRAWASCSVDDRAVERARRPIDALQYVYGDFCRVHRSGLIACHPGAAEWLHGEIERVTHDLLQMLDGRAAG